MKAYKDWIVQQALPFWSTAGYDLAHERFQERHDKSGAALAVPHRAMVQARQIYVFSHAAQLGWFPEGGRLAESAMRSLLRDFIQRSGGQASVAFSIQPNGVLVSDTRDAYAHAFVLFALAWLYRLNGQADLLTIADEVIAFIDAHLTDTRHEGLFDQLPMSDPTKRQNPHMHLLEAYLALDEAAPGRGYLKRACSLIALFRNKLFSARHGVLLEHFTEHWSAHPDPAKRHVFEPGHHFEWVWLLNEYQRLSGDDLRAQGVQLYEVACRYGLAGSGLVFDEVDTAWRVSKRSHRIWPHTEALKAASVLHASGDVRAEPFAAAMAGILIDTFLDRSFQGGWIDQISETHQPLVDYVPASSLYHLFLGAAEIDRHFGLEGAHSEDVMPGQQHSR